MAFIRLLGSAKRYLNTETGDSISYRQFHFQTTGKRFGTVPAFIESRARNYQKKRGGTLKDARKSVKHTMAVAYAKNHGMNPKDTKTVESSKGFKTAYKGVTSDESGPDEYEDGYYDIYGDDDDSDRYGPSE